MNAFFTAVGWRGWCADHIWIFIWIGFIASGVFAIFEHRDLRQKLQGAKGHHKAVTWCKLILLWTVPVLALMAGAASQWGSEKTDSRIALLKMNLDEANAVGASAAAEGRAISNRIATVEPRNQTVVSISANAHFTVRGITNEFPRDIYKCFSDMGHGVASLSCRRSADTDWVIFLKAEQFESYRKWDNMEFFLDFKMPTVRPLLSSAGERAAVLDQLDVLAIPVFFLRSGTEILGGAVTVTINSAVNKEFLIPPQKLDFSLITCFMEKGYVSTFDEHGKCSSTFPISHLTNAYFH